MSDIRTRIILNKGRHGIPLHKLADIAKEAERFFECLGADCNFKDSDDKWLALNFANGSLEFDVAYRGSATADQTLLCKRNLQAIITGTATPRNNQSGVSHKTFSHFANLSLYLEAGENIAFGLYSNGEEQPEVWKDVTQHNLTVLRNELLNEIRSHGAIHGTIHAIVRDHKKPYVEIRDLESKLLVKCYYKPEQYEEIVAALKPQDATVYVSGEINVTRHDHKIESIELEGFRKVPPYKPDTLKRFFGCINNIGSGSSSEAVIAKVRHG